MVSTVKTVREYLASLPADRRAALGAVRDVIRHNLDPGYEEGIQYGMIGYFVPHRIFPAGYHTDPKQPLPFAALASQKNYMSLYMMGTYCGCTEGPGGETADASWFREAWAQTGKRLDMGKACIRFKRVDDLALDVVGEAIRRLPAKAYVERYQQVLGATRMARKAKPAPRAAGAKKKAKKRAR
ncbi:MAG TPA: DUF1801 domain-containing protein [Polyangiaceae bacterium]|jgi:hypothetical protein